MSIIVNSGQNISALIGGLTNSIVDLNEVWSITEEAFEPIVVTAFAEPAEPQITIAITDDIFPVSNDFVQDWAGIFQTGLLSNEDGGASINFVATKNGVNLSDTAGNVVIEDPNTYDFIAVLSASSALVVGDILGIKLWKTDEGANPFSYLNSSLYIVPRMLGPVAGKQALAMSYGNANNAYCGDGPVGSLAGVAYQDNNDTLLARSASSIDPLLGLMDIEGHFGVILTGGVYVGTQSPFVNIYGGLIDSFNTSNGQIPTPILYAPGKDNSWVRYYQVMK